MKKSYSWDEIKKVLIKELKKTNTIMTFGTIGSCNINRDIDIIITKKVEASSSDFYKEIHRIFENLNKYLNKKYKAKSICFSTSDEQFSALYLAGYKESKDIAFHKMIYTSYPQIEKDWNWALIKEDNINEILNKTYNCLLGSVKELFSKEFKKEKYCDPLFIFVYKYDKIISNYPEKVLVNMMNHYFDYLYRKRLNLKAPVAKNKKDVKKYFYKFEPKTVP
ncbi:MAG TPA: hypothetical protein P5277_00280 [Candidatus Paceibacterota bacterium]|nr:hypothetical protein [Candidatus Paceibacterota bacterium]